MVCLYCKRFVVKSESQGNLLVNSIRTSRDRIQYHDKKHNNIENKQMRKFCDDYHGTVAMLRFRFNCITEKVFKK